MTPLGNAGARLDLLEASHAPSESGSLDSVDSGRVVSLATLTSVQATRPGPDSPYLHL